MRKLAWFALSTWLTFQALPACQPVSPVNAPVADAEPNAKAGDAADAPTNADGSDEVAADAPVTADVGDAQDTADAQSASDAKPDASAGETPDAKTDCACPVAVLTVKEGEEVVPQTPLHLHGDKSHSPCGLAIKKYQWTAKQPPGSNQAFSPNANFPNPNFLANAAGEYEFCLDVWDANGVKSCQPDCVKVTVVPNNAVHVELLWDTPGDPDQADTGPAAGADLDLHFAHGKAAQSDNDCDGVPDPWFSNPFDCFWFNAMPNWGDASPNAGDDPSLDLDDTDGAGPENLNLASPEGTPQAPMAYSIGVHYWNDHGFGTSYAALTVWVQGVVLLKIDKVEMHPWDMWYVGKLNWPNQMTGATLPPVAMCYQSGDACIGKKNPSDPNGGKLWQPKGAWCVTPCDANAAFLSSSGGATVPDACKPK